MIEPADQPFSSYIGTIPMFSLDMVSKNINICLIHCHTITYDRN